MTTENNLTQGRQSILGLKMLFAMAALFAIGLFLFPPLAISDHAVAVSQWALFLGRFHPVVVHLPVGVIILAALMEATTLFKSSLARAIEPAIPFVLGFGVLGAIISATFGSILARDMDIFSNGTLQAHQSLCIAATVVAIMALGCRLAANTQGRTVWAYRGLLGLALGLMSVGAHFGGSMVHGNGYLTEYAPALIRDGVEAGEKSIVHLFGPGSEKNPFRALADANPTVYGALIAPILEKNCSLCHSEDKSKGNLRLDTYEFLAKGGSEGSIVTPGNPKNSLLIARILMPIDNPNHMPPSKRLGEKEIAMLTWWIREGANDSITLSEVNLPGHSKLPMHNNTGACQVFK